MNTPNVDDGAGLPVANPDPDNSSPLGREMLGNWSNWQVIHAEDLPCRHPNGYPADETIFIVTPTLNVAETIDRTIQSVISQSGRFRLRYHIQDGESTDGTLEKVKAWDERIKSKQVPVNCAGIEFSFNSRPDANSYDAVQRGFENLEVSDGAFMTWLGGDDILTHGALATVHEVCLKLPKVSWISGGVCLLSLDFVQCGPLALNAFPREVLSAGLCDLERWPCPQQEGTFWRGHLWKSVGGLNTSLTLAADYDLWRRFAQHENLYMFRGVLGHFKVRSGQLSSDKASYALEVDSLCSEEERNRRWMEIRSAITRNELQIYEIQKVEKQSALSVFRTSLLGPHLPYQVVRRDPELCKNQAQQYVVRLANKVGLSLRANIKDFPGASNAPRLPAIPHPANTGRPAIPPIAAPAPNLQNPPSEAAPIRLPSIPNAPKTLDLQGNGLPPLLQSRNPRRVPLHQRGIPAAAPTRRSFLQRFRHLKWWWILWRSGVFLESYYLSRNPDVLERGVDPLYHFVTCGAWEGRNPNPVFDVNFYLSMYPDVWEAKLNPLVHYILFGEGENRNPNPNFSTAEYRAKYQSAPYQGYGPLRHFLEVGSLAVEGPKGPNRVRTAAPIMQESPSVTAKVPSEVQTNSKTAKVPPASDPLLSVSLATTTKAPLPSDYSTAPSPCDSPHLAVNALRVDQQSKEDLQANVTPNSRAAVPLTTDRSDPLACRAVPTLAQGDAGQKDQARSASENAQFTGEKTTLPKGSLTFPDDFIYSKRCHFEKMDVLALEFFGQKIASEKCTLKRYQDLLTLAFLHDHVPAGCRILDVGGGNSRVLRIVSKKYECWNVDKLEGLGHGPKEVQPGDFRLVRAYMGDFSPELPDDYFDFVFSVSALEHSPNGQPDLYRRIIRDIERVSKNGAWSLHLFDFVLRRPKSWFSDCMNFFFQNIGQADALPNEGELEEDSDLFFTSREIYNLHLKPIVNKPYDEFGRQCSATVLWQVKK